MQTQQDFKKTPLFSFHESHGASLAPFAGWLMPISYHSIIEEHRRVRQTVGIFDLTHMGEIWIKGRDAEAFMQKIMTNDVRKLFDGKILYSPICNEKGGVIDDILVHRKSEDSFFLVVNASNIDKDESWFRLQSQGMDLEIINVSLETALMGVQGPECSYILRKIFGPEINNLPYYQFIEFEFKDTQFLISRTGYTGEDGFEIYLDQSKALEWWNQLLHIGEYAQIEPIGLGARDTLRLEMRYSLYGQDITDETTPLEAGLGWTVSFSKKDFIGYQALVAQKASGIGRKLVGFEMMGRGIARGGCAILINHERVGEVTSGSYSPSLNKSIGLGYVPIEHASFGNQVDIIIREKKFPAKIVKTPFYRGPINSK